MKTPHSNSLSPRPFSRRKFLAATSTAAAFVIVPRHVLGAPGQPSPSQKINVGFVGVGAQGLRVMLDFLKQPDVQAVAVCDPNRQANDYPQWSKDEFCQAVRRLLGATSGWEWLSPNQPIQVTHSMVTWGGVAGREPARQIVDAYYARRQGSGRYSACRAYADFRELLEKEKDLDAIVVGTTDHLHAPVSVAAMKKGKYVFCQKPMTHSVHEAWRLGELARETGLATQVAVGNQASEDTRRLCEWVWSGAIGPVRQVFNWSSRPFWPQALDRPKETQSVPEGFDWDLWLGPAPERPFHHVYLPFVWRGWYDFGCGAMGDMGCYSFDTIFRVLKLQSPVSVEATSTERYSETYPQASIIHFNFAARENMPAVKLAWSDGGLLPPRPEELEGGSLPKEGLLFVGDSGSILCEFTGSKPKLLPAAKFKNFREPPKTLARSPGNEREWLNACKGSKDKPGANFEFSARVTETILLGNVAVRTGEKLLWDASARKIANLAFVNKYIRPEYRRGWSL